MKILRFGYGSWLRGIVFTVAVAWLTGAYAYAPAPTTWSPDWFVAWLCIAMCVAAQVATGRRLSSRYVEFSIEKSSLCSPARSFDDHQQWVH